jgi:aarF domain-containing kinase
VHAATLRGGGKPVVLKVLKPRVEDTLMTDLNFLYLAGKFLQIVSPEVERTSLAGIIEDIRASMLDEVGTARCLPCLRAALLGSGQCS